MVSNYDTTYVNSSENYLKGSINKMHKEKKVIRQYEVAR